MQLPHWLNPARMATRTQKLADEQQTQQLAQRIAAHLVLSPALRIDLYGALGAGKTTFVRHLLRSLGVEGRIKSPTYALLEEYELPALGFTAYHFDLYRLESPQEWQDSGLHEAAQSQELRLIEWPQKAGELLGQPDLAFEFAFDPLAANGRHVHLHSCSNLGEQLLHNALAQVL